MGFKRDLLNIARTTLSSKIVTTELDFFAQLCVDAVLRLKGSIDLDMIQIIKKQGGSMKDSFLDSGFILDKNFGLSQATTYKIRELCWQIRAWIRIRLRF